jgi:quinol monooxygenase YgiN
MIIHFCSLRRGHTGTKDGIFDYGGTLLLGLGYSLPFADFAKPIPETPMSKLAFFARFEAKPGKEDAVAKFLEMALDMAKKEATTIHWYALRLSPTTFGVFDTFNDEAGRQKHLNGPIGQALMAKAPELFSSPPSIEPVEVLGEK